LIGSGDEHPTTSISAVMISSVCFIVLPPVIAFKTNYINCVKHSVNGM